MIFCLGDSRAALDYDYGGTLLMIFCLGDSRAALDYDYRDKTKPDKKQLPSTRWSPAPQSLSCSTQATSS